MAKKRAQKNNEAPAGEGSKELIVVGIGASAGGLEAFEQFFTHMPPAPHSDLAFVVVQHLVPDHKSILTDLVKRYTRMQVYEVTDGMEVRPHNAYIIPPNRDMALLHGKLHLLEPETPRGLRLPIDHFFRSLAQDRRERAIGIVLAGTGSDGTRGLKAIKEIGGMVMAQDPASARYDGMPRSAIATGLVDYILPPDQMPAQLLAYVEHAFGKLPPQMAVLPMPEATDALHKIFILLRNGTGHDFSYYKQNTIHRRVERRMAVNQVERLDDYVRYLQQNPAELETLFKDLLIGVTNFFRNPEAFDILKTQVVPAVVAGKSAVNPVRVWIPGCSTGEEAYSIAILFQEHRDELRGDFKIQIFASDIDAAAIDRARAATYSGSIAADVSPERLARFFTPLDAETYYIKKSIRDLVVFAEQNVVEDPPFSKIDLISCRNLLIYMEPELQKKVLPLFHYALNPEGFLFLGNSESVGEFGSLFAPINRKWKLYQRNGGVLPRTAIAELPIPPLLGRATNQPVRAKGPEAKLNVRELTEQTLLEEYSLPCALINEKGEVLYIHGRTGKYLEPASGEASLNILRMAREGIRLDLTAALRRAAARKEPVRLEGLQVKGNGDIYTINLIVRSLNRAAAMPGLLMVLFEDVTPTNPPAPPAAAEATTEADRRMAELEGELKAKEEHLQTTLEEMETSNEELKSTNEELQSTNEELQSTNEELETSKEELQSVNEELVTVNTELQKKVEELSQANNDMNNLMAATEIGTIFVDHHLNILRFTPAATQVINLIQSDVGRPISHIVSKLANYDALLQDTRQVLKTLVLQAAEVQTHTGQWYLMRIMPYRTLENVIEGAVITFVEITEQKRLQESEQRYRGLFEGIPDAVLIGDLQAKFLECNSAALRLYGYSQEEFLALSAADIVHPDHHWRIQDIQRRVLAGEVVTVESRHRRKDGQYIPVEMMISQIEYLQAPAFFTNVRDISDRKEVEKTLRRLATVVTDANDAIILQDFEGQILAWNPAAERMYGWSETEALAMNIGNIISESKQAESRGQVEQLAQGKVVGLLETQRIARDGRILDIELTATALIDAAGKPYAIATTERDITGRQR